MKDVILPDHPYEQAIVAILQFMDDRGLVASRRALEQELAPRSFDPSSCSSNDLLLDALEQLRLSSVSRDAPEQSKIIKYIASLDASDRLDSSSEHRLVNLHSKNIICCCWQPENTRVIATGSADRSLKLTDVDSGRSTAVFPYDTLPAVPLDLAFHPVDTHLLAVACMDGSVLVIDTILTEIIYRFVAHENKHTLRVRWSSDGEVLSSAGADHSVCNFRIVEGRYGLVHRLVFASTPESIQWIAMTTLLLVAIRNEPVLHLYDGTTFALVRKVNLNSDADDSYCNFNVLDLAVAHSSDLILATTDRNRAVLIHPECPEPIYSMFGAINDEYSTPRTAFSVHDAFVFSTSQDNSVVTWELRMQKTVDAFKSGLLIRDIDVNNRTGELLACSYDKSVRTWQCASSI